jgi:hypothetical protein
METLWATFNTWVIVAIFIFQKWFHVDVLDFLIQL